MGFLDFLKGGKKKEKEPVPIKTEKVKAEEVLNWFEKTFKDQLKSVKSETKKRHSTIEKTYHEVQKAAGNLGKAKLEETTAKANAAALMLRDSFVKKIKASKLPEFPKEMDYTSLSDFCSKAESLLTEFLKISPKQAFFLSKFFTKEAEAVTSQIKQVKEHLSDFTVFLDEEAKIVRLGEQIKKFGPKRKELLESIKEKEKEYEEVKKEVESKEKEVAGIGSSLKALLASKDWKRFEDGRARVNEIMKDLQDTDHILRSELESVKRPLKKLAHVKQRPFLSPYGAIIEGKKNALLESLKEIKKNKALALKPKEIGKVDRMIENLDKEIPELVKKHKELQKNKRDLDKKIETAGIRVKREQIEDALARKQKGLDAAKKNLQEAENNKKRIERQLLELKESVERKTAQITERKLKITELQKD